MAGNYPAQERYDANNSRHIGIKLNIKTDADILAALDAAPNKQGYIKQALRAYAENKKEEQK